MKWYYYLHTNGDIIGKNPVVVESDSEYFNSSFVRKVWLVQSLEDVKAMLAEALELGARKDKIKELAEANGILFETAIQENINKNI